MSRSFQLPMLFFVVRLVRGVRIFEPLGKKLLGRHALGGDFGGLSLDFGYQRMKKKREKVHCLHGANPVYHRGKGLGGTLANFFQRIFGVVPDFQETNVYEPNFAHFLGDFHVEFAKTKNCLDSWGRPVMNQNSM